MPNYDNQRKYEKAIHIAIGCMVDKRKTTDDHEEIEKLDNAIRILQRVTEASK